MASGLAAGLLRYAARHDFGAHVTAIAIPPASRTIAFGLGDGTLRLVTSDRPQEAVTALAHDGACLTLLPDLDGGHLLSGGDDGRLVRTSPAGETAELGRWPGRWLDAVAVHSKPGLRAVAVGRQVLLLGRDLAVVQTLDHPSTAAALAFDPSGQRLVVAHYGGVSLWVGYRDGWRLTVLPWKGSHTAVGWSPSGRFIVSAMQENVLHGWRLADRKDMRMAGYPTKVRSMDWAARGRWLATSGAENAVLWPFRSDEGPMGKPPLLLGGGAGELVTTVAAHPKEGLVAMGFKDGGVELARIAEEDSLRLKEPGDGAVSAMAWTSDGRALAIGTEEGWAAILPLDI